MPLNMLFHLSNPPAPAKLLKEGMRKKKVNCCKKSSKVVKKCHLTLGIGTFDATYELGKVFNKQQKKDETI